jgi:hypothetical protein
MIELFGYTIGICLIIIVLLETAESVVSTALTIKKNIKKNK